MPMPLSRLIPAIVLWLCSVQTAECVDFSRDVLPILAENCFHCHGPAEEGRRAGLRLDIKEGAFRTKRDRTMIVPGKSAESEVIRRILSEDPDEQMPPPDSNRKLTEKQKATLKRWVDEGAVWGQHWAYLPPQPKPLPTIPEKSKAWVRNPIDAFILARLQQEQLQPSPEATRERWLRRVTLDLTGLPPTLQERDAFLKDQQPDAYERVVDRLLASPAYGERMATDWLDLARYADTHGYQADRAQPVWPYRDWVIQAFNRNMPFDEFVTWQLAGDLLPNATKEQRLATAFNRLHMQNEEGGIVEEEFRVAYVVDRVNTFATAFLGQTFECTRCHDHKYDPFTQKDYYQLFAYFQNIDESGQTSHFTYATPVPTLLLTTDEQDAKIQELRARIREKEAAYAQTRKQARMAFDQLPKQQRTQPDLPKPIAAYAFDTLNENKSPNANDDKNPATGHDGPTLVPGRKGQAVALTGENGFNFPGVGHFSRTDPFSISLWVKAESLAPRAVVLHHSKAPIDAGSRGYELLLENGRVAVGLHHMWPGNSLKVATKKAIAPNAWTHIAFSYDGSSKASGLIVSINGQSQDVDVIRDRLTKDITYENGEPNLALGNRFRDNGFKGGQVDDLQIYDIALTAVEMARLAEQDIPEDAEALFAQYFERTDKPAQTLREELRTARKEYSNFVNPIRELMVMQEDPVPKPAYVLNRGAYDALGERVSMDVPAVLPRMPEQAPRNRLGLARWLTRTEHPLFARVTVNRLWQQAFGQGLVETSDNFGTTGIPPTHPELLDWLALDFARDWNVQRVLKQIVLSSTYRQDSAVTPELLAKDPYNHLLARAPARRLSAEMLRDQALAVSGLLTRKQGGPSVYPYQPEGIWNEAMGRPNYPRSKGEDLYRRGLYTFWKRTAPPPMLVVFDAADRSNCAANRQATNTPLQALVLLNDPTFVEAARFLAARSIQEHPTDAANRAAWIFRTAIGRAPTEQEKKLLLEIVAEQQAVFAQDTKAAQALLAVGDGKTDVQADAVTLATWTTLAQAILNHDEAVNRR